jgi:hypothetical protein
MTQITAVEEEDYIILFMKPELLDDYDDHYSPSS